MDDIQQANIRSYIIKSARPLDVALYNHKFENGSADAVISELQKYQNEDKGFGHGLEPDIRSTSSSVICTTVALQYLQQLHVASNHPLALDALMYLEKNFTPTYYGWHPIGADVENAPHAPWWNYNKSLTSYEWGNPSAEIIGYFTTHKYSAMSFSVDELVKKAILELHAVTQPEVHAVMSYLRMFRMSSEEIKLQVKDVLFSHIKTVVSLNSSKWGSYVPKPLDFAEDPDDEAISLFREDIIRENIGYIEQSLLNDHWEPSWNWADQHPEIWQDAKKDWSGKITVENLLLLDSFKDLL